MSQQSDDGVGGCWVLSGQVVDRWVGFNGGVDLVSCRIWNTKCSKWPVVGTQWCLLNECGVERTQDQVRSHNLRGKLERLSERLPNSCVLSLPRPPQRHGLLQLTPSHKSPFWARPWARPGDAAVSPPVRMPIHRSSGLLVRQTGNSSVSRV